MKSFIEARSLTNSKKSFKQIYVENRLLYAKETPVEIKVYDQKEVALFLERFYAKRRRQKTTRAYLFALSCIITALLALGFIQAANGAL